jgi:hypothetical protein
MQLSLTSISHTKTVLCNVLELFAQFLKAAPCTGAAAVTSAAVDSIVDLLAHGGFSVSGW